ncbi:S1 family peptidase, partial [Mycobacterium shimoidei]
DSSTCAAPPSDFAISPTTSHGLYWKPVDSDPDYTLNHEEPTNLPYSPPERRRSVPWRLVVALAALALMPLFSLLPPALKHPAPPWLPPANAIGPGIGIDVRDDSSEITCTAGFLVRDSAGHSALLTAGHCNRPGGPSQVTINYAKTRSAKRIGTFSQTIKGDDVWQDHDIALIELANVDIPLVSGIAGHAVSGVSSEVRVGEQLCHVGIRTRTPACGPVVVSDANKVAFEASSECGDSGGPVYSIRPDGSANAVAVHVAGSDADDSEPSCQTAHRFSIAEPIKPWLDKWNLTLVTTPARAKP